MLVTVLMRIQSNLRTKLPHKSFAVPSTGAKSDIERNSVMASITNPRRWGYELVTQKLGGGGVDHGHGVT